MGISIFVLHYSKRVFHGIDLILELSIISGGTFKHYVWLKHMIRDTKPNSNVSAFDFIEMPKFSIHHDEYNFWDHFC